MRKGLFQAGEARALFVHWCYFCLTIGSLYLFPANAQAAEPAVEVVFGSYTLAENLARNQQRLQTQLGIATTTKQVEVKGQYYFRLLSLPTDERSARDLRDRARRHGYPGAWLLRGVTQPAPADPPLSLTRRAPPAQPPAQAAERPVSALAADQSTSASSQAPTAEPQPVPITLQLAGTAGDPIVVPFIEDANVALDGLATETVWQGAVIHDEMKVIDPDSLAKPDYATRTRLFFTNRGLYVAAQMDQPQSTLVARLSSRDQFINRDAFGITLDTSGEGLYGYWFKVNLGGSLMDGKVVPERNFTEQWDGAWRGESKRTATGWSVEMFLPWSMMALPVSSGERRIGIWIDRKVAHSDEQYGWPALPFTDPKFMSALQPLALPNLKTKRQLAVFPYVSATHDAIAKDEEYRVGADIAWRPTPNTQVTAALNPDFGSVESDAVVVNLTAFETFFPEKRLFFLEGTEVFVTTPRSDQRRFRSTRRGGGARATPSTFTPEPTTLLNTRRIGGPPRQLQVPAGVEVNPVELGKPTDLLGAVKSTGSIGGLRYGVLGAFEDDVSLPGRVTATGEEIKVTAEGRDFGVIRALYEASGRTRRSIGYMGTLVTLPDDDSIAHGLDAHYLSEKGRVKLDAQAMASDANGQQGYGALVDIVYSQRRGLTHYISLDYMDDKFDVGDLGFIRQNDIVGSQYGLVRNAGGQPNDRFRYIRNSLFISAQSNTDGFLNRMGIFTNHTFLLPSNRRFRFEVDYYPERWDDRNSRGNGMYKTDGRFFTQIAYGSDSAKRFSWSGTLGAEQEELNGTWTYSADLGFTFSPIDNITLDLDMRFKKRDGWLVYRNGRNLTTYSANDFQPRLSLDYFITARQQLRLTLQWAGIRATAQDYWQIPLGDGALVERSLSAGAANEDFSLSRLTMQFRYRWELGPLSDLFVVYTRGSNLAQPDVDSNFGTLFTDAVDDPVLDFLVLKLRYRFGL